MIRTRVRSTGERGIGWFLIFSLSLHGLFLVLVLLKWKSLSIGYQTETTVSLVSEDVLKNAGQPAQNVQAHKVPVMKAVERKVHSRPKPVVHPHPTPDRIQKSPVSRPRVRPKPRPVQKKIHSVQSKAAPHPSVFKKPEMVAIAKKPKPLHASKKSSPSNQQMTVPVRLDLAGERFPTYLQHVLISRIKSNWSPPPGSHGMTATIHFVLKKNGTLESGPVLMSSSGSRVFDDAARYAILRSVPFPPFPPSYGRDKESVTVTLQATKRQGL